MTATQLTAAHDFCSYHHIEYTLISSFYNAGLIELDVINQTSYIPMHQLPRLERMVRLYNELGINVEGIEAISHLLQRIEDMQHEMQVLKNRLSIYE